MEIFSVIIQFFDFLISSVVSMVNVVRYLWRELILATVLIVLALLLIYFLRAVKKRHAFIKAIKTAAKENGVKLYIPRPTFLSLLFNLDGYDIEFDLRGTRYRLKLAPFITSGIGVHLDGACEAVYLGRPATRRAMKKGVVKGVRVHIKYDPTPQDDTVNLLVFSPAPISVFEKRENGGIWEMDTENGQDLGGVLVFTDEILASRLPRLIDGYIDELVHRDEV